MNNVQKYLIFSLGQRETYALDIAQVVEIRELLKAVPAPKMTPFVKGFASFRGAVITIVDLAKRFGVESTDSTRTIVTVINDNVVGLDVSKVLNIIELNETDDVVPYSSIWTQTDSCITSVIKLGKDGQLISVVDLEKVF